MRQFTQSTKTLAPQAQKPRRPRSPSISKRLQHAIRGIILEGKKKKDACDDANLTVRSYDRAIKKPHVIAWRNEIERGRGAELHVRSLAVAASLMETSDSDHVRLQAAQWVHERTDPNAAARGADTSKTLIININPGAVDGGQLIRDQRTGTVKLLEIQPIINVPSDRIESND